MRQTILTLSFSTVGIALSFYNGLNDFVKESYPGELDAYKPLFRVFITTFLCLYYLDSKLLSSFLILSQLSLSFLLFNTNLHNTQNYLPTELLLLLQHNTLLKHFLEIIPYLSSVFLIYLTEKENEPVSWEPLEQLKPSLQRFDKFEARETFEKVKNNIRNFEPKEAIEKVRENIIHNFDTHEAREAFKHVEERATKAFKEAENFIIEKAKNVDMKQINQQFVPDNLSDEIFEYESELKQSESNEEEEEEEEDEDIVLKNQNGFVSSSSSYSEPEKEKEIEQEQEPVEALEREEEEEEEEEQQQPVIQPKKEQILTPKKQPIVAKSSTSDKLAAAREEAARVLQERTNKRIEELKNRKK